MPTKSISPDTAVSRIKAVLPALVDNLNNDDRLPWARGVTVEDIQVAYIPVLFVTSDAAHAAARKATEHAPGRPVRAEIVGTRLIVTDVPDEELQIADFTFHSKERRTIGAASIKFNEVGEVVKINASNVYEDGAPLKRGMSSYIASACTVLIMNSCKNPASGVTCTIIDGVEVYEYKHALDSDAEHQKHPIQYRPQALPRMRNELAKELRHFPARAGLTINGSTASYFREIAESIEGSNEMWWVSEDMSKLAWDVAMSGTEPEDLEDSELPTPSGIMWLNGGGGPALLTGHLPDADFFETGETPTELLSINAIVWYTPTAKSSGIQGLKIGKTRFMGLTASPELARDSTQWDGPLCPLDVESNLIDYFRIPTYATFYNLKYLPRKLALIVMRLAREENLGEKREETVSSPVKVGGAGRKKSRSKKIETITCALLRRREYASESEREAEAREYSHRWIVRGHMRNQAVGPRNAKGGQKHERVWIAPYVKGPEDKPLILKDRVQVWR